MRTAPRRRWPSCASYNNPNPNPDPDPDPNPNPNPNPNPSPSPSPSPSQVAKLRVELDAERHLRRDLQQEANRFRSVRHRTLARAPLCMCIMAHIMTRLPCPRPPAPSPCTGSALLDVPGIRGAAAEAPRRPRLLQGQHQEAEAPARQLVTTEPNACHCERLSK